MVIIRIENDVFVCPRGLPEVINMWDALREGMGAVANLGFLFRWHIIYYRMFLMNKFFLFVGKLKCSRRSINFFFLIYINNENKF